MRAATLRARADRYLVVAPFAEREGRLAPVGWVLRKDVFAKLANKRAGWLEMLASSAPGSRDRWAPYQYAPWELAGLFETAIAVCADGRVKELPDARRLHPPAPNY